MTTPPSSSAIQKYIGNYPPNVVQQVQSLVDNDKLAEFLLKRHPTTHSVYNDSDLREYVLDLKNQHLKEKEHNKVSIAFVCYACH